MSHVCTLAIAFAERWVQRRGGGASVAEAVDKYGVFTVLVIKVIVLCSAQDIQQLAVTAGENVMLPCNVKSDYPKWFGPELHEGITQAYNNPGQSSFPNGKVPEQKRARLDWGSDKKSLIIRNVILIDEGLYQCASIVKIILTVRVPPKSLEISNTESVEGTLIIRRSQSQETMIVCTSSGGYPQPNVEWYRGNIGTEPLTSTSSVTNGTNTYTVTRTYRFTPKRQDDGVNYICRSSFQTAPRHIATTSAELLLNLMPNSPIVVQTSVVSAGNQAVISCTTTGSRPAASITWSYRNTSPSGEETITLDDISKTYSVVSLLKMQVTAEDNGQTVQCKISHTLLVNQTQLSASLNLNVRFSVQLSSTRLTGNREIQATGSNPLMLNCTTGSSNPASDIKWLNGSAEITKTGPYTNWTGSNNGQVRSEQLVLHPTRYMDGDVIQCEVSNVLNSQSPVLNKTTLNLKYSPIVTIEGQEQYTLTEGDSKTLYCKVESKPSSGIIWYHNNVKISNDTSTDNHLPYSLSSVNRTHYGIYKCKANNGIGTGDEKNVTIKVRFKPLSTTITGDTNIIANGRNEVELTCTSESSNPVSDITWKNNSVMTPATGSPTEMNGDYGGKKRRVALKFKPTRYNDGDIISCEAKNTIGTSENSTKTLDLRYRPLITPIPEITVIEGYKATFTCKASSKPVSTFKWYRGQSTLLKEGIGTIGNNGFIFTKENVTRTDAGTYRCNANNGVEVPDSRNVILTVQYPPDVKVIATNTTINASRLVLTCNATGVPNIGYKYGKWIQRWSGYNSYLMQYSEGKNLELSNLTYEHSGLYTCSASNGIQVFGANTKFIDGSVNLVVESFPLVTNYSDKVSAKLTENTTYELDYYSNVAQSDIKLYKNVNGSKEEQLLYPVLKTEVQVDLPVFTRTIKTSGTKARVLIPIKTKQDLGVYNVVVSNKIGQVSRSFEIVPEGPPSVPTNITVDEIQFNSARISWVAGYHGGFPQTFVIQTSSDLINWRNDSVNGGLSESTDPMSSLLSHLSASTTYYVRMLAYNNEGRSHFTEILNYTTSNNIGPPSVPTNITVDEIQFNSARISWVAGYHGGFPQTFVIQTSSDLINWRNDSVNGGLSESTDPMSSLLSHLSASTTYYVRMLAYNNEGRSHFTEILNYTTSNNIDGGDGSGSSALIGGVAGGGVALVIIVVVLFVIFLKRRGIFTKGKDKSYHDHSDREPVNEDVDDYGKKEKEKKDKNRHVHMKNKKGKKVIIEGDIYENASPTELKKASAKQIKNEETIYENPEPKKNVNKDGHIYADLTFNDQPNSQKKLVIHGLDSMTEYVEVDFTKKADPLPDSDDENVP